MMYVFELLGCNESNLQAVKAAIATIPGVSSFSITMSALGSYVLFVECDYVEEEILSLLNAALTSLGVTAIKAPPESKPKTPKP